MIFWLALLTSGAAVEAESPALLDRIVAQVDESVILWSELNLRVLTELEQVSDPRLVSPERIAELRKRALSAMVDDEVLVLKARKDSIEIDVSEVEEDRAEEIGAQEEDVSEVRGEQKQQFGT